MDDELYMERALALAKKGAGRVNPNPLVGAVIVKDGRIIGEGYHQVYGGPHAEVNAFNSLTEESAGSTMYVTLEPCAHYGKTPPCVDGVIAGGVVRVVIASLDPNPLVAGKSVKKMEESGIEVCVGVLKEAADKLNEVFFHYITHKTPYVVMKYAMTADGKIATHTGKSRWITGETAREKVHQDRNFYTGIMVGVGTVLADDPMLDCRTGGRNPIRIICDTQLKTPKTARVVTTAHQQPTWLLTACLDEGRMAPYLEAGCQIIQVKTKEGHLDLKSAMVILGERGIDGILLEGGATLNASMLTAGLIQKVQTYIAPKLFGGSLAPSPIGGAGIDEPDAAYQLTDTTMTPLGDDICIESYVLKEQKPCLQES